MNKLTKLTTALLLAGVLTACADLDSSLKATDQNYQQYVNTTAEYKVNEQWWKNYHDPQLDQLIETALNNNLNLAKSAIAVNLALYNANLIGADLVPTFSGKGSTSATKDLQHNGNSQINSTAQFNLSYTLDLWRKLSDATSAAEWEHKATVADLAAARLVLINAVVNTYYTLSYLNSAINATQDSVTYYKKIQNVIENKYKAGITDDLSTAQAMQAVLVAQNNLLSLQSQRETALNTMRNLLNLKPNQPLNLTYPDILKVKTIGVNLDVPVSVIANRPDVQAAKYRLQSAFKSAKATQKSWFPSVSLGANLNITGTHLNDITDTVTGSGLIGISLPFLSWQQVKWNVKISEEKYQLALINFEQAITSALNEINKLYFNYRQSGNSLKNIQEKYNYDRKISSYYKKRYDAGISELKDWLTAENTAKIAEISLLNAKYNQIKNETAVYQAMAGYYSK
ncbi:hypothetical protein CEP45_02950 [Mergibacter septicus]|uniref:toxin/drug exporter TdeA n=1 Tax=Mergibacter septicus TaxID=221402 RepID=UPI001C7634EA|nr:TolC family protein [Mergibacter septicus]QDJ12866.1 hypothetical protein CEP45_02950 [Mergibacter septicus]